MSESLQVQAEEEITKEIEWLRKKYSTEIVKKQTDLRNKIVNVLVPKLKDNLQDTGSGDWKILDNMIKSNEEYANRIYRSDISETTKHYGSVIKTGYNGNGKPYTHPIYLTNDLPGQILTLLKDIDVRTHSRIWPILRTGQPILGSWNGLAHFDFANMG